LLLLPILLLQLLFQLFFLLLLLISGNHDVAELTELLLKSGKSSLYGVILLLTMVSIGYFTLF
jgi:hypothetical protein